MDTPSQHPGTSLKKQNQMISFEKSRNSAAHAFGQRIIDIGIALPVVLFVLPVLMLVVSLIHACASRGPLFYQQERCGRDRKMFSILKFRTMTPVTEAQRIEESNPESRVFRGGHLVRFSKIDEVPQFVNVLRGEMSVVGPRPHHLQDCLEFESRVAGYSQRHVVKPGITGLAQIREYAGEFRWNCINSRVEADSEYIRTRTLWGDMVLILRTFSTVALKCQRRALSAVLELRSPEAEPAIPFMNADLLSVDTASEDLPESQRKAA